METGNNLKYIIYLTTNLVNNKIYIGLHKTYTPYEFDGYLGCGVKIGDKHTYIHCNTPFESAVNKYGVGNFKRETLFVFDTLEEAINKEIELVDEEFIKRKDTYNVALGGGVPPAITKTVYQFTLDGEFIKEWHSITEAACQYKCHTVTISRAVLDKTPSLGFLWGDKNNINVSEFKIGANKNKVYLYDINGNLIKEFNSQALCSKFLKIKAEYVKAHIVNKTLCKDLYYMSNVKADNFKNITEHKVDIFTTNTTPRRVGKFDLKGNLICEFNTVREAKRDTAGAPMVLTGKRKTAGGFVFKYI